MKPPLLLLAAAIALTAVVFFSDPGRANVAPLPAAAAAATPVSAEDVAAGQVVLHRCGTCHSLGTLAEHPQNRAGWQATMQSMAQLGAGWTQQEQPMILNYLVRHFGAR